jgi:hypothetical protein
MGPTATMEPAPSVEAASPAKSAATMLRGETAESTATANRGAAAESAVKSGPATSIKGWPATIESRATPVESAATIETVEPRPRADKHAPDEIVRAIVAVWRAGIRGIVIVAVGTGRRRADVSGPTVDWPDSNSKPHLRVGSSRPCNQHQKPKHCTVL